MAGRGIDELYPTVPHTPGEIVLRNARDFLNVAKRLCTEAIIMGSTDNVTALIAEKKRQLQEMTGRLDAMGLELDKEKAARAAAEDPQAVESKVQARLKLVQKCQRILGDELSLDGKSDEELKLMAIKKFYPDVDLSGKDQSYIDGMFEAILSQQEMRNDSLTSTRVVIQQQAQSKANQAYEKWVEHSAKMWTLPLAGKL